MTHAMIRLSARQGPSSQQANSGPAPRNTGTSSTASSYADQSPPSSTSLGSTTGTQTGVAADLRRLCGKRNVALVAEIYIRPEAIRHGVLDLEEPLRLAVAHLPRRPTPSLAPTLQLRCPLLDFALHLGDPRRKHFKLILGPLASCHL